MEVRANLISSKALRLCANLQCVRLRLARLGGERKFEVSKVLGLCANLRFRGCVNLMNARMDVRALLDDVYLRLRGKIACCCLSDELLWAAVAA